jgi:F-type H+-transporting ATPase subunit b
MAGLLVTAADSGGNFLVSPSVGLMIWTLLAFLVTYLLLRKLAFPRIQEALQRRQKAIDDSIDAAERTRREAEELLGEYRERLREARKQADDIMDRARKAGEQHERETMQDGRRRRDELLEAARRNIEIETQRAIQELRKEVADLTVLATEKVTRKALDDADQRRLVDEALSEMDFTALAAEDRRS